MTQSPTNPSPPQPTPPRDPRSARGSAFVRWLSTWHLVGLPELKRFRDPLAKAQALDEIADGKIGGIIGVLSNPYVLMTLSGLVTLAMLFLRPLSRLFNLPATIGFYADISLVLIIGIAFTLIHRPAAAHHLRRRLVDSGIPVCLQCGYNLRGLAPNIREGLNCPECGTDVSPKSIALLTSKLP